MPNKLKFAAGSTKQDAGYMVQLDALRFFAVLGVMIHHNWHMPALPWILSTVDVGTSGVRLFFVLSGFLITGILLNCRTTLTETGQSPFFYIRQFYIRRALRIFPLYYLVLTLLFIINFPQVRDLWLWLISYTTNFYIADQGTWIGRVGHFWTLAVEEQFYLFWPWLVLFITRRRLLPLLLLMIVLAPLYRYITLILYPLDFAPGGYTRTTFSVACFDSLGMGALLALLFHTKWHGATIRKILNRVVLPVGAGSLLVLQLMHYYQIMPGAYITFGDTALALLFCWLVGSAALGFKGAARALLTFAPLVYLGKITYGIYVYHNLIPYFLAASFAAYNIPYQKGGLITFALSSIITIVLAALSWHLFEQPINNLKQHFTYDARHAPRVSLAPEQRQL